MRNVIQVLLGGTEEKNRETTTKAPPRKTLPSYLMLVSSLAAFALAPESAPFVPSTLAGGGETDTQSIDEFVISQMRSARIPGLALTIVKGDRIVYSKGYGRADPSGRAVTPQTPFLIGSITKSVTALAVMQLVDAGKVELDAPVQRYIPWFRVADPQASVEITVRQLINQTSGIPQEFETWTWPDEDSALERHVRLLGHIKLTNPPGRSYEYSNANYVILGVLVQTVSGESFKDYCRQHIFAPLEMQHSFVSQDRAIQDGMAMGYRWWFGIPVPVTIPFNRSNLPAGFAIASAEDMGHFLIAQMNGGRYQDRSILSPDRMAQLQAEPAPHAYGLGWESVRIDGRRLINNDGGNANFEASVFFDPQARVGVFVAANAMSALDALSTGGATSVYGPTVRGIAETVLSLVTDQSLPRQGLGHQTLYVIYDLALLALTGALVAWLARIPRQFQKFVRQGIADRGSLARQTGTTAVSHIAAPLSLLLLSRQVPGYAVFAQYQPDIVYWLYSVAAVVSLKGLLEIVLKWRVFKETRKSER